VKDEDFKRISVSTLIEIPSKGGTYRLIKNHWWMLDKEGMALRFKYFSYQCNSNKLIGERMIVDKADDSVYPGVKQIFLENVWLSVD